MCKVSTYVGVWAQELYVGRVSANLRQHEAISHKGRCILWKMVELGKESAWACIACTLFKGKVIAFNTPPANMEKNQSREHLKGGKHCRALRSVGHGLFDRENVYRFFQAIDMDPEKLLDGKTPIEAVKEYTKNTGGDAEYALSMMPPPPPPVQRGEFQRIRIKKVTRAITSSAYCVRKDDAKIRTKMLCCWDDPDDGSECLRDSCPYIHASTLKKTMEGDPFGTAPCASAGMPGGCRWHGHRLGNDDWIAPEIEFGEEIEDQRAETPNEDFITHKLYAVGQGWVFQEEACDYIVDAVKTFLEGLDD